MFSTIGSNIAFCGHQFNCNIESVVYNHSLLLSFKNYVHSYYSWHDGDIAFKAEFLLELLMIRQGLLHVPGFALDNINSIIDSICTE